MGKQRFKYALPLGCLASAGALSACTGVLGGGTENAELGEAGEEAVDQIAATDEESLFTADVEACGKTLDPGSSPIRRLSRSEYNRTLRDLTGDDSEPANSFPEEGGSGFDNNADVATVSRLLAGKYREAAEATASDFAPSLFEEHDCVPANTACVRGVVTEFGEAAYRRPLSDEEVEAKVAFFEKSAGEFGEDVAARMLVESVLQSPHYLYRVELSGLGADEPVLLEPWELASRLSYFLWGTLPDEELRQAAASGALASAQDVHTQARRMLADDRAAPIIEHFHNQWMGIDDLSRAEKDQSLFGEFDESVVALLEEETSRYVDHIVSAGGTFDELMTSDETFLNAQLADYYGYTFSGDDSFQLWEAPAKQRSGLLSQGSVIAAHSKATETGVIQRGLFVREQIFCQIPPPPPDGVETELPPPAPDLTMRERVSAHRADPACAPCHEMLDPLGFGFEHFDAIGRYRSTEDGLAIDATGDLVGTDSDQPFDGLEEFAAIAAESRTAHECYVTQWFRFTQGRTESEADACTLTELIERFDESERTVLELIVALTQTDAFLYRKAEAQ